MVPAENQPRNEPFEEGQRKQTSEGRHDFWKQRRGNGIGKKKTTSERQLCDCVLLASSPCLGGCLTDTASRGYDDVYYMEG